MKDSVISILVFNESTVQTSRENQKNVHYFEAFNLSQAFQIFFQNPIDVVLCAEGKLPETLELFLKNSGLTPLIDAVTSPFSKVMQRLENQKLAQKNVSLNEQFELIVQYGEWMLPENNLKDIEPIQLICPPGAETEAAALALHLKSSYNSYAFEVYRFENQSERQIEEDLWGYFVISENPALPVMSRGLFNTPGTLLLIEANRMPPAIQQKLFSSLAQIKKRLITANPIPLLSLSQNNLYSKELAEYFSRQIINMPALEDRLFDLPAIADQILSRLNKKYHLQIEPLQSTPLQTLTALRFENGYKELEALLTLAALKRQKGRLTADDFKIS
jgi:transcriptional regulator of acetoin/glycerol metabolism